MNAPEHAQPLTNKEFISGIGTDHTIYSTPLTIDSRCQHKLAEYLNSDNRIQSYSFTDHQVDIFWKQATEGNIIFFFERMEFQYLFPCAK